MQQSRKIAVIGSGISGLSAAWLLHRWVVHDSQGVNGAVQNTRSMRSILFIHRHGHYVTLFESEAQCGGHTLTAEALPGVPVDLGFQVMPGSGRQSSAPMYCKRQAHDP